MHFALGLNPLPYSAGYLSFALLVFRLALVRIVRLSFGEYADIYYSDGVI